MLPEGKKKSSSAGTVIFMLGAVLFAAVAGVLLTKLLSQQYADEPVVAIVVAAKDVQAGHPLTKATLRIARWPRSSVPRGAKTSIKALVASQAVPLVPIAAGQAVLASQLSKPNSGLGVAAKLRPGQRAVAIQAAESVMQARLLYPGARVDVLTTMRKPGSFDRGEVLTKVLLQNVRVLAVGPRMDAASTLGRRKGKKNKGNEDSAEVRRVVTVAVSADQAELLVLAKREGKIDLVLRSPQDDAQVRTPGATPRQVLGVGEGGAQERRRVAPRPEPLADTAVDEPAPRAKRRRRRPRRRRARPAPRPAAPAPAPAPRRKGPTIYRGS